MTEFTSCITFNSPPTEKVLRLDKEGFHYRGQFIADAGEAHRLMVEFLRQNTATNQCDAKPRDLIRRFIDALEMLMKWECWYEKDELDLLAEARAYLDQPEPQMPTDEELDKLLYLEFTTSTGHGERVDAIGFARFVLQRWGNQ
jgi:hypothetical protein